MQSTQVQNLISLLKAREAIDEPEVDKTLKKLTNDFGAKHIDFADLDVHCDAEEYLSLLLSDLHRELQGIGWKPGSPEMSTAVTNHFAHLLTEIDKCKR